MDQVYVSGLPRWDWPLLVGALVVIVVGGWLLLHPPSTKPSNGGWLFATVAGVVTLAALLGLYWFFTEV